MVDTMLESASEAARESLLIKPLLLDLLGSAGSLTLAVLDGAVRSALAMAGDNAT